MSERGERLGVWCGWVLVGAAALTPLLAWLGPLGFAPLVALAGLLCIPALRVEERERPLAILLLAMMAWAAASTLWSTHRPEELEDSVPLKLALQLPLYAAAWCGARRVPPHLARLVLRVLVAGLAALAVVLLIEAFTGAALYQALRQAIGDPIASPYARKNVAQGVFVIALLWPVAVLGARGNLAILALPIAVATAVAGQRLDADAPVVAAGLALAVALAVLAWPTSAPRVLSTFTALLFLLAPLLVLPLRGSALVGRLPQSWADRVSYWSYAVDRIAEKPFAGWGLDASRDFGPRIGLHPHNGSLQAWLELGAVGAALGALVFATLFRTLAAEGRSLVAAGAAASAAVYLLFGMVSFGVWQEWWLALGAFVAVIHALARRAAPEDV